ncbi:hypothetical protein KAJ87_03265 [Candidatus Pacearchaeota archaeon]|nr:hypothetical protein [Candidatus Pacearchaeota archaeon]
MKRKILRFFLETRFKKEFQRQIRMLIIVTLGFTIAFTWRQTIFDLSLAFVKFVTKIQNTSTLSIFSSAFITLFSIFIIYLTAHFLKGRKDYN